MPVQVKPAKPDKATSSASLPGVVHDVNSNQILIVRTCSPIFLSKGHTANPIDSTSLTSVRDVRPLFASHCYNFLAHSSSGLTANTVGCREMHAMAPHQGGA